MPPRASPAEKLGVIDGGRSEPTVSPPGERGVIVATPFKWVDPADLPPRPFLYGSHLLRGYTSVDLAPGGVGKSTLKIGESLAMVTGRNLYGKNLSRDPLRVWLYNFEDPADELQRRIAAVCQHFGITEDDIGDRLFVNSGQDQGLVVATSTPTGTMILEPMVGALVSEVRAKRIDVVIADPFVSCHEVNENDNSAIDKVVKQGWGRVVRLGNCAVNLVHHVRKGGDEVTADSSRGASALIGGVRSALVYNRMTADEADRAGVDNPRRFFRTFNDKANLAPPSERSDWYELRSVVLPNGDSVGVATSWEWPDLFRSTSIDDLVEVQRRVAAGAYRFDAQANDWVGNTIAEVLDLDLGEKSARQQVKQMVRTWIANGSLKKEMRLDNRRREKEFVTVGQWACDPPAPPCGGEVEQG